MKLQSRASHSQQMLSGYGRSRKLAVLLRLAVLLLKQDQLRTEVQFLEIFLVALANFHFSCIFLPTWFTLMYTIDDFFNNFFFILQQFFYSSMILVSCFPHFTRWSVHISPFLVKRCRLLVTFSTM